MICHQGSARASQRLRQGSLQQPKVSPAPAKPTHFIQPIHPQKPWGTMAHPTPQGPCLPPAPGGHRCSLAFTTSCGLDHPGMGYSENTEHSTSPSCQLRFLLGVSEGAQGLARFKRAPASTGAAQGSCPVCKAILEPSDQGVLKCLRACQQLQQNPSGLAYLEGYFKPLPN